MFAILRTVVLALAGVLLALFSTIGATPTPAVAPTAKVPTKLILPPPTATTTLEITSITKPAVATTTKSAPKPVVTTTAPKKPTTAELQSQLNDAVTTLTKTLAEINAQKALSNVPASSASLNETVRNATINIICSTAGPGPLNSISASGVIVDPRGIILTNAHVAQYFLLKDYTSKDYVTCIIRTGSPAYPKYNAELVFIPPSWIDDNAQKIVQAKPTGNGEHDYAFIRITTAIGSNILPEKFPYLPVSAEPPNQGQEVLIAGYPAGFLGGITIMKELYAASSIAKVGDVYTFGTNTLDLFSIGGSIVAQQGSSGGAVADGNGVLVGLISTTSEGDSTGTRDLRAVATSYIAKDFANEHGESIGTFFANDPATEAHQFQLGTAPTLTQQLVNALQGH